MKQPLDHNITDALITSDEWESFDYNLRLQIEELAKVDYDNQKPTWKENTLANTYLFHVEKLLRKTGGLDAYTLKTIEELKKVIMNFEGMKILLLTLRLATLATRAGIIPEIAQMGVNTSAVQSKKGSKRPVVDGLTPEQRDRRNMEINEHFKKVAGNLSTYGFAKKYEKKYGLKQAQIRKILKDRVAT